MNLEDALKTFVIECRELLIAMEEALLRVEQAPDNKELINEIFRAMHTIKGSAGLFGLDHIVQLSHHAENVLDMARSDQEVIDHDFVALFLDIRDHVDELIYQVDQGISLDEKSIAHSCELIEKLTHLVGDSAACKEKTITHLSRLQSPPDTVCIREELEQGNAVETDNWHISLRFSRNVLKNGMDPLSFIRYLTTFGRLVNVVTLTEAVPSAELFDPEDCYLGFEISFQTVEEKSTIEDVFEFVRDEARIRILPPHSKIDDYKRLIESMPEEDLRLGEILVRCGTLTQAELTAALMTQATVHQSGDARLSIGEVLVAQSVVRPDVVEAAVEKQIQIKANRGQETGLIRVSAEALDGHINLIGELIIAAAGISITAQKTSSPALLEAASVLNRLVEDVRDSALLLRMVQIGGTFNKFQRVVRDMSKELGKDICLDVCGAETELDKTVVEKIGDPLTHLVRNAIDHGIESAEERVALGKPAQGTLRLNAFHDSGSIVIEVSDDGSGLNKERIVQKAIARGVIRSDQVLSEQEIFSLIFEPGFSTAKQVNNLSGRGVGMDVVRRNISALRGSIEIESCEGVGSTMRIRLPLTLAIIDGFLIGVGNSAFIVPLEMVVECVELSETAIQSSQGQHYIDLRGDLLPYIHLKQLFDIPDARQPATHETECDSSGGDRALNESCTPVLAEAGSQQHIEQEWASLLQPIRRENVVVVNYGGQRVGLVVDSLQGEYQTVIRPLGKVFSGLEGIGGFTILGTGNVALILDVPGLVRRITNNNVSPFARSKQVQGGPRTNAQNESKIPIASTFGP